MQRGHSIDLAEQIDSHEFDSTAIMDIQSKKLKKCWHIHTDMSFIISIF